MTAPKKPRPSYVPLDPFIRLSTDLDEIMRRIEMMTVPVDVDERAKHFAAYRIAAAEIERIRRKPAA